LNKEDRTESTIDTISRKTMGSNCEKPNPFLGGGRKKCSREKQALGTGKNGAPGQNRMEGNASHSQK